VSDRTESLRIDAERTALLLVDLQPDFMPGGALAVAGGDAIVAPIRDLVRAGTFRQIAATQDWHPPGHVSFASAHPGRRPFEVIEINGHEHTLWPDHCVRGTAGAQLHAGIPWDAVSVIVRKGMEADTDSYSGLRNNWDPAGERRPTGLGGWLRERGVDTVFCCGLARDVCVKWTAEDAAAGFRTWLLWDLTRAVNPADDERVRRELLERGVRIAESGALGRP